MRYCVDGGRLGKWCRVRIAHNSDDVNTQFRNPHTSMIDFSHVDWTFLFDSWYPSLFGASAAAPVA